MTVTTFTSSVVTSDYNPIFSFAASGDTLIVGAGVTLANQGDAAVNGRGTNGLQDLTAVINGTVSAPGWAAVDAFTSSIDLTVGGTGRLQSATGAMAFEASFDSRLTNNGVLYADRGFGAVITDATTASVTNSASGSIFGEVGAIEFSFAQPGSSVSVTNHGQLEAGAGARDLVGGAGSNQAIYSDADTTTILNTGSIFAGDRVGAGVKIAGGALSLENSGTIRAQVHIGVVVQGNAGSDIVNEGTISGTAGSISLSRGADTVTNDGTLQGRVILGGGDDVFHGENGRVSGAVWGQGGNDLMIGGAFADILGGGGGNDTLTGGGGRDVLTGAAGADLLSGGAGDDVFRFAASGEATGDRIVASGGVAAFEGAGIAGGDIIDLSAIDAHTGLAGNQQFSFGTTQGIGALWAVDVGDVTHIRGNTAGGAAAEFDLAILDGAGVHASDYTAADFIL